jgi:hypothetical protein
VAADGALQDFLDNETQQRVDIDDELNGKIGAEAAARASGDAGTLEAAAGALAEHDTDADAHADIRQGVADNTTLIKALQGVGGYLTAHDFGAAAPDQQDFTGYALEQIGITEPLDVFNGTRVKNTFDNHVWVLANTPDTEPPVFLWMDDGEDVVDVAGTSIGDVSAEASDAVVTSGTLVNLLKSLSGRVMALLARFNTISGHRHTGTDSPQVAYANLAGAPASLPASDVSAWAKAANKPGYSYLELDDTPSSLPATGIISQLDGSLIKVWLGTAEQLPAYREFNTLYFVE